MKTKTSKDPKVEDKRKIIRSTSREDAESDARDAFWTPFRSLCDEMTLTEIDEDESLVACEYEWYNGQVRYECIERLRIHAEFMSDGKCPRPFKYADDTTWLEILRRVLMADTTFYYTEDDGGEYLSDESDTLDDESVLQADVISALDQFLLDGAALAKRVESKSYEKWTDGLLLLAGLKKLISRLEWQTFKWPDKNEKTEDVAKEVIEQAIAAEAQLWADWRVWNCLHPKQTTKTSAKKRQSQASRAKDKSRYAQIRTQK